jgi:hypothetical protein
LPGEAEFSHDPDAVVVVEIVLIPGEAVARGDGVSVLVVVPAFAAGQKCGPPQVAGVVCVEKRRLPQMCVAELTSQVACRLTVARKKIPQRNALLLESTPVAKRSIEISNLFDKVNVYCMRSRHPYKNRQNVFRHNPRS